MNAIAAAQAFIRAHTEIAEIEGIGIRLHQATEVTPLWLMTEADLARDRLPPPFWAFPWAGGQALARYILENPEIVRGKRVIDIACGSGLVAIAAAKAGAAKVCANDIDPYAEAAVALNSELNAVSVDFVPGNLLTGDAPEADVFLAGDICYEKAISEAMLTFFRRVAALGSDVYIGDPHRSYFPSDGLRRCADYDIMTTGDIEDTRLKAASVWKLETVHEQRTPQH